MSQSHNPSFVASAAKPYRSSLAAICSFIARSVKAPASSEAHWLCCSRPVLVVVSMRLTSASIPQSRPPALIGMTKVTSPPA
jgi:hypothetical protein